MKNRIYALVFALILAAGCGSAEPSETVTVYASPAQISAEAAPSVSSSPSPSPAVALLPLGDGFGVRAGVVVTPSEGKTVQGSEWVQYAVHVQICRDGEHGSEELLVGLGAWSIRTEDGGVYDAQPGGSSADLSPGYPLDEPIAPGECLRGWMGFNNGSARPAELRYRNSFGESAAWDLG